jgi:hypothetical protein
MSPLVKFRRLLEKHGIYEQAIECLREHRQLRESAFAKLSGKLSHQRGIRNPDAVAATIGREKLGKREMTRRSVAGRKH